MSNSGLVACLSACLLSALVPPLIPPAHAQAAGAISVQYIQRAWDTRDGLPQNSVTTIVQARDGYLWLGTFGGLVRFDGNSFTVFDPGNTPGLASARIISLFEDRKGALWIGTEGGLSRFAAGQFTNFAQQGGLLAGVITAIGEDAQGQVLIGGGFSVVRFDGQTFATTPLNGPQNPIAFAVTPDGSTWMATWREIMRAHGDQWETVTSIAPLEVNQKVFTDSKGRLWYAGLFLERWDHSRFVRIALPVPQAKYFAISALTEDRDGTLWIGTTHGGVFAWRDGAFASYTAADGLGNDLVRSMLADRDGNLWIGTDVGGLKQLKPRRVFSYQRPASVDQSIAPIVSDGAGGLWIGATCGGLLHFSGGAFRSYTSAKDGLPHECLWSLYRDPDGTLWIGSAGSGLIRMRDGRFTQLFGREGLPGGMVNVITRDRAGSLWVGTDNGLSRLDNDRFTNFGAEAGVPRQVTTITADRRGVLWIGGDGLQRFENGRVKARYSTAEGLSHNLVRAIYEDADGVLWIGTYGGGLNRFKDGRFTTYGLKEGLPDVAVSRIIEDERGNLWMSGNKGVFRVARSQLNEFADGKIAAVTSVSYGTADGMIIDETNGGQPAGWRTPDGKFWFPTIKGLVSIDPSFEAATPPPVVVERTVVDGASADAAQLQRLGPGRADAEFHYTAIDLAAAEKTRFRYRLDGYDRDWIDAGTRRVAFYTNIPPGSYRFEVAATDSDGRWTTTPAVTALVVAPLWWQRRPVQAVGLVLLLFATGYGVRFVSLRRARARLAELEREQALERERSRIARDLHDDLGSRLAQIALIAESPSAAESTDRISSVAREAMHTMDELVWTVNARNDTVESLAEFAAEFAEEHLSLAGIRYRFDFEPDLEGRLLTSDTRRHLFLAYKEAIHNVVKHAGASEVHVGLAIEDGWVVLAVADNGRGFPADRSPGTGNGLRNMKERMEAACGRLDIDFPTTGGTRLVFRALAGPPQGRGGPDMNMPDDSKAAARA